MIAGNRKDTINGLIITILLGIIFTALQAMEYFETSYSIADSVFGSSFFVATGFHGLHVIIGTLFLIVSLIRVVNHQLTKHHHAGFEASILY